VIEVPVLKVEMQKHRELSKKVTVVEKNLNGRYDKLITTLMQCLKSSDFKINVRPKGENIKFDHAQGQMYLSRAFALGLQKDIRKRGLLPAILDVIYHVSRAMSYVGEGSFLVDQNKWRINYQILIGDFVEYTINHPDAPNRLVRRATDKAKKEKAVPTPPQEGNAPPKKKREKRYTLKDLMKPEKTGNVIEDALSGV